MKIQENMISSQNELFNENKNTNEKLTHIQSKFDKLASDNEMLQSQIIVAKKITKTLQENLNSKNSKTTILERSVHKLEQYSRIEYVEIAGIPRDIPHVILEDVVIKLLNKLDMILTKNDLVACHKLANSNKTIMKVLNRKYADQIMNNKSTLKGMNFSDILNIVEASNTSNNIDEQKSCRRNRSIYVNYSLCSYYRFLYGKFKKMMQEGLIYNFWVSNGGIIKIRESASLVPFSVSHENYLILEY